MFEAAELGRKVSREEFDQREPVLHAQLLEIQRELNSVVEARREAVGHGRCLHPLPSVTSRRWPRRHGGHDPARRG